MKKKAVEKILFKDGFMVQAFPAFAIGDIKTCKIDKDIVDISDDFSFSFDEAGYMTDGTIYTSKVSAIEEPPVNLERIVENDTDEKNYNPEEKMPKWTYLKGSKKIPRVSASGYKYTFSEGAIAFPDPLDRPARTMLTSESTLNRSSHVVCDPGTGKLRVLTPVEAERIQGFDDGWTDTGMPERMRYFCLGNALVVPMVTRMGKVLDSIIEKE